MRIRMRIWMRMRVRMGNHEMQLEKQDMEIIYRLLLLPPTIRLIGFSLIFIAFHCTFIDFHRFSLDFH